MLTTSALYNKATKVLRLLSSRMMKCSRALWCDPCELVPAVPSPPPCQLHRNNRPRSHPPHFASTASLPPHPSPQSSKVRGLAPAPPPFVSQLAAVAPPPAT